jgi:hypothetical protein
MTRNRRLPKFSVLFAFVLVGLTVPSSAFGQATRTWVSGVGDDANPCSRTAPCKTFAGAISKTANGGEINCLDPGGFGGVTITKSITLSCKYTEGGVLVSGTNAIVINAASTDRVTIRGLDINGVGVASPATSLVGIKILSAGQVKIVNNDIYKFRAAIAQVPTSLTTRVTIANNDIHNNGIGVINAPGNNLITFSTQTLRNNDITDNTCGVVVASNGTNASTPDASLNCGAAAGPAISRTTVTGVYGNGINDNNTGLFVRGSLGVAEIARNEITGSSSSAMRRVDAGAIRTFSQLSNVVTNNAASDGTSTTTAMQRRR